MRSHQICSSTEGQWRKTRRALHPPFPPGCQTFATSSPPNEACHPCQYKMCPSLSNFVLCHLSFCFALRLSELLLHMQLAKPEWIVHCVQTTPPSFFSYINFLILIPKFCFITAPFFFPPHRRSHLVLPGPTTVGSFQPRDKVTEMGKAQAHLYPHPFH